MLKLLGGVLVLGGCWFWGVRAAKGLSEQVYVLDELIGAVCILERELVLFRPTLPDLLEKMAQGRNEKTRQFLNNCRVEVEAGTCFADVWVAEMTELPLSRQVKDLLRDLGQVIGRYDDRGQVQAVERIRAELEAHADRARKHNQVQGKLYRTLGATAGGFLLLTLI